LKGYARFPSADNNITGNLEIAREVLKMGANDYIGKPLNLVLLAIKSGWF